MSVDSMSQIIYRKRLTLAVFAGLAALTVFWLGAGCSRNSGSGLSRPESMRSLNYPIRVLCTTGQVADLVRNVGGKHVEVEALMGPSVDPHQFKATISDLRKMSEADVIFYNGLHLEGRLSDVLEDMAKRKPVFAVADRIVETAPGRLRTPPEFEGAFDPHVWFDIGLWTICAEEVAERLRQLDSQHADDYTAQRKAYVEVLLELQREVQEQLAEIPKERRLLVTAHDAFGYFGRAYDIEVHGLQGISTADEADLASKQKLINLLVERRVKAVFVESSVPEAGVRNLIDACAQRGHKVATGGELYSDAMGQEGTPEGTYIGMMRYNVRTIVQALK